MSKSITINDASVGNPPAPTVTPQGTTGAAAYSYVLVARAADGRFTGASVVGSTATGNAVLTGVNKNHLTWVDPAGAELIEIYRTVGGGSIGIIGSVAAGVQAFDDTGLVGDGTTAPVANSTGVPRGASTYLSGSGFTPGRTVAMYVNGQYAGVMVGGPYGAPPALGNFGAVPYGSLSGDVSVPLPPTLPAAGAGVLAAVDMTDGTSTSTPITTL
jgi:hypothetical protein